MWFIIPAAIGYLSTINGKKAISILLTKSLLSSDPSMLPQHFQVTPTVLNPASLGKTSLKRLRATSKEVPVEQHNPSAPTLQIDIARKGRSTPPTPSTSAFSWEMLNMMKKFSKDSLAVQHIMHRSNEKLAPPSHLCPPH